MSVSIQFLEDGTIRIQCDPVGMAMIASALGGAGGDEASLVAYRKIVGSRSEAAAELLLTFANATEWIKDRWKED